ncbi:hypothetical protein AN189_03025 [Loktanella sp. 3ANDIMAR09]|uniref:hypothetical protein n=1 Tax=Loktanella sp. 3ANDIMAR09 TaxID=1225657 RepID=UPI0006FC1F15|nr:hypothetical protein [Loktanella sp. 3ANDIMAR09]KQI69409.1 hypothetical protein AN189_03025 [Loktanella sp. 3ANDIMAR09]
MTVANAQAGEALVEAATQIINRGIVAGRFTYEQIVAARAMNAAAAFLFEQIEGSEQMQTAAIGLRRSCDLLSKDAHALLAGHDNVAALMAVFVRPDTYIEPGMTVHDIADQIATDIQAGVSDAST